MWDLDGPGIESMSFALAGGFLTIEPPRESSGYFFFFLKTIMFYPSNLYKQYSVYMYYSIWNSLVYDVTIL